MNLSNLNSVNKSNILTPQEYSMNSYAQEYITAVETADGQSLEPWYKQAVNRLIIDLLRTNAVSQSSVDNSSPDIYIHLFCGARTLNGMLIPLWCSGFFPMVNSGFVLSDYNRKTGLKANGTNRLTMGENIPDNSTGSAGYWQSSTNMCAYCNITETHSNPQANVLYVSTQNNNSIATSDIWLGQLYDSANLETAHLSRIRGGSLIFGTNPRHPVSTGLMGARRFFSGTNYLVRRQMKNASNSNNSLHNLGSSVNGSGTFKFFSVPTPTTGFENGNFRMNLVAIGSTPNPYALESCLLTFLNTLDQNNFS